MKNKKLFLFLCIALLSPIDAAALAGDETIFQGLELVPTYNSISVYARFSNDLNKNNQAILEYREAGGAWKQGMALTPDRRDFVHYKSTAFTNTFKNQWRGSILLVKPGTEYDVKVTFQDSNGVSGTNPMTATTRTWKETSSIAPNGNNYYVSVLGNDVAGDGSISNPWRTIQKAANAVNPGDIVNVRSGIYNEKVTFTRSGASANYITFRSYNNEKVIIDPPGCNTGWSCRTSNDIAIGFVIKAKYLRIKGFEFTDSFGSVVAAEPSSDVVIENNLMTNYYGGYGVKLGSVNGYGDHQEVSRITVQNNVIETVAEPSEQDYGSIEVMNNEGNHVIRNNVIEFKYAGSGSHGEDCITSDENGQFTDNYKDTDIYNNLCIGSTDDSIEADGSNVNTRIWNNTIYNGNLGASFGTSQVGPLYFFRNLIYDLKYHWTSCTGIKTGRNGDGHVYMYHNVFYLTDKHGTCEGTYGITDQADRPGSKNLIGRNNIFVLDLVPREGDRTRYMSFDDTTTLADFDYNLIYDYATPYFARVSSRYDTFDSFVDGTGMEQHGINAKPLFTNADNGNFRLNSESPGINNGVILFGFNDADSAWPFFGSAPDIGAFEFQFGQVINDTPKNDTNMTGNVTPASAELKLVEGYPYDHNYAFECIAKGFNATNYTFNFGDGSSETRYVFDIYHSYKSNGTRTATCTATDGKNTASGSIIVNVKTDATNPEPACMGQVCGEARLEIISISDKTYTFKCRGIGYTTQETWWRTNGQTFPERDAMIGDSFSYTYPQDGTYDILCAPYVRDPKQMSEYYDPDSYAYHQSWICDGKTGCGLAGTSRDIIVQTIPPNQTNTTPTQTCYSKVNDLPVNCTGTITQDTKSGCRTIACSQGTNNIKILACDKPDTGTKTFFEMYRQAYSGTPPQVCIGNTCIQNEGYRKSSNYPICLGTQTNGTANQTSLSANIIFSYLSTDALMIAQCEAYNPLLNQNATSWRWDFGDGIITNRDGFRKIADEDYAGVYQNNDILHIFTSSGPQNVMCTAKFADGSTATASKLFNSQVQNNVIVHFQENNSAFNLWADPINIDTKNVNTALNLYGYPYRDNSGEVNTISITSRAVPPNETYNKPAIQGTWEMEWEVQTSNVNHAELAVGYTGANALNFFGYLPNNITGYRTIGITQVPIYQGVDHFPFSVPYGYLAIGGINSVATYKFSLTIPNQTSSEDCFSRVNDAPATCTSAITQDTSSGSCRTIQCGTGSNAIKVLACDKPDTGTKTFFEMYRQSYSGSPSKVCIGNTCIQNEGYKKSINYPICA